MSSVGRPNEIMDFNEFLGTLNYKYKIIIAGNHDYLFEREPKHAQDIITNAIYLQDSEIEIEGMKIYGSPWQPNFNDWAFNLPRGKSLRDKWAMIPEDTDILITHGPPLGHGDETIWGNITGCRELLKRILIVKPKYHIYGHIHEGYGITREIIYKNSENGNNGRDNVPNKDIVITCINASVADFNYDIVNKPIAFDYSK